MCASAQTGKMEKYENIIMSEEASLLGLQVNWAKTKIQCIGDIDSVPEIVHIGSPKVEVVNELTYLAAHITGDSIVSPRSYGTFVLPTFVWHCWRSMLGSHISRSIQRSGCIKPMSSRCWCMDWKRWVSQRLLFSYWMPLTHGLSKKSFGSLILDMLPVLLSGRLLAALQFQVSLKQEVCVS